MARQTHLFDQGRKLWVTDAGAPLDAGANRGYPVMDTGGGHNDASGYNWICGFFAADQTFRVDILQGQTNGVLPVGTRFNSLLDAVTGRQVTRIKVPVYGEYVGATITSTSGVAQTVLIGELYVMPVEGSPLFMTGSGLLVEGTDDDGAAHSNNPIQIAGWAPGAAPNTVTVPSVVNPGGILARQLIVRTSDGTNFGPIMDANTRRGYVQHTDGTHDLVVAPHAAAVEANGLHPILDYEAVPGAVASGQGARMQGTAYGRQEPAAFSRAIGADQVLEVAPVQYDVAQSTLRASAALAAAGAYDTPIEIPTGNRQYLTLHVRYTRGAAGGAYVARLEKCLTIAGTDYWSRAAMVNYGAFAAGADVLNEIQRNCDYQYVSTSAAAEDTLVILDVSRVDKFRVSFRESGVVGTPGTLLALYKLTN